MKKYILYTSEGCAGCKFLKAHLDSLGMKEMVEVKNISIDEEAKEEVLALGVRGVPCLYNKETAAFTVGFDGTIVAKEAVAKVLL